MKHMKLNRRKFISTAGLMGGMSVFANTGIPFSNPTPSKESLSKKTDDLPKKGMIFINHLGFHRDLSKFFVITDPSADTFVVRRAHMNRVNSNGEIVYSGSLFLVDRDLGQGWVGDFSSLRNEGTYVIQCGQALSQIVTISSRIYEYPLRILLNFINTQRCGDTSDGWNSPCHINDGISSETGENIDVSGGWHQSCDLRKWTIGTIYGLPGLASYALHASTPWSRERVLEEIHWGNKYFHKMVRKDGGLMDYVTSPPSFTLQRTVQVTDAPPTTSFLFIFSQAMISRVFKSSDPDYSDSCLALAERVWNYLRSPTAMDRIYSPPPGNDHPEIFEYMFMDVNPGSSNWHGYAILAATGMLEATGGPVWEERAVFHANELVKMQFVGEEGDDLLDGCFIMGSGHNGIRSNNYEPQEYIGPFGLCRLISLCPGHKDSARWSRAVEKSADRLLRTASRNPWGLVAPYAFNSPSKDTRSDGSGFYSYFYHYMWSLGSNMRLLGCALFLIHAAAVTARDKFLETACRQIDWIIGCNPLNRSTVEGIGRNQPERLMNTFQFFPPVPQIPGAVMTGIPGDEMDNPREFAGGTEAEYDMPGTGLLMWIMGELSKT